MTDKELRKLSRLELLELLLEVSKENRKLKKNIEALKVENSTAQNIRNLSEATLRVENALKYANSLTNTLETTPRTVVSATDTKKIEINTENKEPLIKPDYLADKEIYIQILCFFAKNDDKLDILPDDIKNSIKMRINEILKGIKTI